MKGFKTRTVRPGSARPKTSQVPGVTETAHPDLNALFIESKLKDVKFTSDRTRKVSFETSSSYRSQEKY